MSFVGNQPYLLGIRAHREQVSRTCRVWFFSSNNGAELRNRLLDDRELFRIKNLGLPDQTIAAERKIFLVLLGQLTLDLQLLIQALTDGAVSTIGSHNNISLDSLVVDEVNGHLVVRLGNVEDALAEVDLMRGDQLQHDFVVLGSRNDVMSIAGTTNEKVAVSLGGFTTRKKSTHVCR